VGGNYTTKGGDLITDMDNKNIHLNDKEVFIENTRKLRSCLVNYAYNFLKDGKSVCILTFDNKTQRDNYLKANGLVDSDLVDISTLQKIILPRNTRSRVNTNVSTAVRSKHTKNVFQLKTQNIPSYTSVRSDYWEEVNVDLDDKNLKSEYAWVDIERFEAVLNKTRDIVIAPSSLVALNRHMETIKKQYPSFVIPKIIGVKFGKTDGDSIRKATQNLKDFVTDQLKSLYGKDNLSDKFWAGEMSSKFSSDNYVLFRCVFPLLKETIAPNAFKILNELKDASTPSQKETHLLTPSRDIKQILKIKDSEIYKNQSDNLNKLSDKLNKVEKALPLLKVVDQYDFNQYRDKKDIAKNASIDYVQTRDFMLCGVA
jgi:hypothetical protein